MACEMLLWYVTLLM